MTAETANTPAKRLYLCVQTMYLKNDVTRYRERVSRFHQGAAGALFPGARDLIDAVEQHVATGALYKALKEIRKLMKREERHGRGLSGFRSSAAARRSAASGRSIRQLRLNGADDPRFCRAFKTCGRRSTIDCPAVLRICTDVVINGKDKPATAID